jgi:hypothetical protein
LFGSRLGLRRAQRLVSRFLFLLVAAHNDVIANCLSRLNPVLSGPGFLKGMR